MSCQKKKSNSGPAETRSKRAKLEIEVLEVEKEVAILKAKNLRKEHEVLQLKYDVLFLQREVIYNTSKPLIAQFQKNDKLSTLKKALLYKCKSTLIHYIFKFTT